LIWKAFDLPWLKFTLAEIESITGKDSSVTGSAGYCL